MSNGTISLIQIKMLTRFTYKNADFKHLFVNICDVMKS